MNILVTYTDSRLGWASVPRGILINAQEDFYTKQGAKFEVFATLGYLNYINLLIYQTLCKMLPKSNSLRT